MREFAFQMRMPRVVFGAGALRQVRHEVELIGAERALVLSTPGQKALAERVVGLLGPHAAGTFSEAVMHVPIETSSAAEDGCSGRRQLPGRHRRRLDHRPRQGARARLGRAGDRDPDHLRRQEMTTMYGLTEGGAKRTGRDAAVLPRAVIDDPELSLGLPRDQRRQRHQRHRPCRRGPVCATATRSSTCSPRRASQVRRRPAPPAARPRDSRRAATRCSAPGCAARSWLRHVGLHHKLCHTLGGSFGLPHAELHTVVLPHALAYNAPAAPRRWRGSPPRCRRRARRRVCSTSPPGRRGDSLAGPRHARGDLDRAADLAMQAQYPNPRPLERGPCASCCSGPGKAPAELTDEEPAAPGSGGQPLHALQLAGVVALRKAAIAS